MASIGDRILTPTSAFAADRRSRADGKTIVAPAIETLERNRSELPFGFSRAPGAADVRRSPDLPPLTGAMPAWLRNYWQVTSLGDGVVTSYYFFHANGKIERTSTRPASRHAAPAATGGKTDVEIGAFGLDRAGTIYVRWEGGDLERIVPGKDGPRSGGVFGLRTGKDGAATLFAFGALGFTLKPTRTRRAVNVLPFVPRLAQGLSYALEAAQALFSRAPVGGEGQ
jgi:hypothetical protein